MSNSHSESFNVRYSTNLCPLNGSRKKLIRLNLRTICRISSSSIGISLHQWNNDFAGEESCRSLFLRSSGGTAVRENDSRHWLRLTAAMYNTRGCGSRVIMKVCTSASHPQSLPFRFGIAFQSNCPRIRINAACTCTVCRCGSAKRQQPRDSSPMPSQYVHYAWPLSIHTCSNM